MQIKRLLKVIQLFQLAIHLHLLFQLFLNSPTIIIDIITLVVLPEILDQIFSFTFLEILVNSEIGWLEVGDLLAGCGL